MSGIIKEFEIEYEVGSVVAFKKHDEIIVGVIEGYYEDDGYIWYNIRTNSRNVYTESNNGSVFESDVLRELDADLSENFLQEMEYL